MKEGRGGWEKTLRKRGTGESRTPLSKKKDGLILEITQKGGRGIRKSLDNMPIIPIAIFTHFPYFSVIQFMNTHMINQILPLLLMESTPQGITQENTVITILTRLQL